MEVRCLIEREDGLTPAYEGVYRVSGGYAIDFVHYEHLMEFIEAVGKVEICYIKWEAFPYRITVLERK